MLSIVIGSPESLNKVPPWSFKHASEIYNGKESDRFKWSETVHHASGFSRSANSLSMREIMLMGRMISGGR